MIFIIKLVFFTCIQTLFIGKLKICYTQKSIRDIFMYVKREDYVEQLSTF